MQFGLPRKISANSTTQVFQYIINQKHHHQKTTFTKEYDEFTKLHGLQND